MRIATWNVNSLNVRLPHVLDWLAEARPDLLCLQETKLEDERFPRELIEFAGYHVVHAGQKTYNGVAILSRQPARDVITDLPGLDDPQRRVLGATFASDVGEVRVLDLYVPNGQAVGSDKYAYKLDWLAHLKNHLAEELSKHPKLVVVGDFNIAPTDADCYDPDGWRGGILCSDAERAALATLLDLGFTDLFRQFSDAAGQFSWWDYRGNMFAGNKGLRIDLILTSAALSQAARTCTIDSVPRAWGRPSDHTPVVADFR
ncbi:MAG: exodeoxyribonuclease III [Chromatiales bacterium]|nr:exodeoxyribonuclease III [Gammaproteobacteria bacterium]MCP5352981.1 exodeoxyribonuclease III [Chromatiales bacterium]